MRARAYDKQTEIYFQSEVFAKINTGWYEKQLLLMPTEDGGVIKLFDCLDKSNPKVPIVLINSITSDDPTEWIHIRSGSVDKQLADFSELLKDDVRFFEYYGYPWLFNDKALLVELLNNQAIPFIGSVFENKYINTKINGWNYISSSGDINFMLHETHWFHDSVLKELRYTSGSYVNDDKRMLPYDCVRKIEMHYDSQQCNAIEMVFEGVTALNLRPFGEEYTSEVSEASLFLEDAVIFFCDGGVDRIDESYSGTWIKSYSLRWRFVE